MSKKDTIWAEFVLDVATREELIRKKLLTNEVHFSDLRELYRTRSSRITRLMVRFLGIYITTFIWNTIYITTFIWNTIVLKYKCCTKTIQRLRKLIRSAHMSFLGKDK